ncbi:hypothetical protein JCM11251_006014 [Rhodosporidiobolus azoricus]
MSGWLVLSQQVPLLPPLALGWTYTGAWSLSFYPQAVLNWQRKSVTGLSIDFLTLNPLGFACYTVSNLALFASTTVRKQYADRHDRHYPHVQPNDVAFASHALVISLFTLGQSYVYKRDPAQRLSSYNRHLLSLLLFSITLLTLLASTSSILSWLDLVLVLSYIKLYISFAKYVPQAVINYKRKSTEGWSVGNILLDFTGGSLSLAQLVLDSWIDQDWKGITGNPGKLGLSFLSLAFDLLFLVQHYILYRHPSSAAAAADRTEEGLGGEGERERLLPPRTNSAPV